MNRKMVGIIGMASLMAMPTFGHGNDRNYRPQKPKLKPQNYRDKPTNRRRKIKDARKANLKRLQNLK